MKSIATGALTALMVTTATAQRDAYLANAVLPGCKSFIALVEGRKSNETLWKSTRKASAPTCSIR
jgi:hypothetical protein